MRTSTAYLGAAVFDGRIVHERAALLVQGCTVEGICPAANVPDAYRKVQLDGGWLAPGFVDLQVNGGGGVLFNDAQTVEVITRMARAHASLGTTSFLPTLISDRPAASRAAVRAVEAAIGKGIPGIEGLHLEGPHFCGSRKGVHDARYFRTMTESDVDFYLDAVRRLPCLVLTVSPKKVRSDQISTLASAGVVVSLGHTEAGLEDCLKAAEAGASMVTHLFNAMSQLESRNPGCVGAGLDCTALSCGVIADGIHVHPASLRTAVAAKRGPGRIFLISDAMACVGTELLEFKLGGRSIYRSDGALRLDDGTLAGANLDLAQAVRFMIREVGLEPEVALRMATSDPAALLSNSSAAGFLAPGKPATFNWLDEGFFLGAAWIKGRPIGVKGNPDDVAKEPAN